MLLLVFADVQGWLLPSPQELLAAAGKLVEVAPDIEDVATPIIKKETGHVIEAVSTIEDNIAHDQVTAVLGTVGDLVSH